jgi:ribosomal protein L11 methyltransferase
LAADPATAKRWLEVTVRGPSEALDAAAEGLFACGAGALQEITGGLRTWFPEPQDPEAFFARLRAAFADAPPNCFSVSWEWQPDEDWSVVWKRGLAPRRIGPRVIVTPSWCAADAGEDDVIVTIDPQMAFGTGEHASTRGVIRLLQGVMRPGVTVLDVGTGSAVLAIAAIKLGAGHVVAVEGDAEALPNAAENIARNGVGDRLVLEQAWVDAAYLQRSAASYDVILANVLSGVLRPLLPAFRSALRGSGHVILAGILANEADMMRRAALAAGFRIGAEDREAEWWSVLLEAS